MPVETCQLVPRMGVFTKEKVKMSQDFRDKYIQSLEDQISLYKSQTTVQQTELDRLREKIKSLETELAIKQSSSSSYFHEKHSSDAYGSDYWNNPSISRKRKISEERNPPPSADSALSSPKKSDREKSIEIATSLVSFTKSGNNSQVSSRTPSRVASPENAGLPKTSVITSEYTYSAPGTSRNSLDYESKGMNLAPIPFHSNLPGGHRTLPRLLSSNDSYGHRSSASVPHNLIESRHRHALSQSSSHPPQFSHRITSSVGSLKQMEPVKPLGPACDGCRVRKRKCGRERPHCSYCVRIHRNRVGPIQCNYPSATANTINSSGKSITYPDEPSETTIESHTSATVVARAAAQFKGDSLMTPPIVDDHIDDVESEITKSSEEKQEPLPIRTVTPISSSSHHLSQPNISMNDTADTIMKPVLNEITH